jgi:histidine triad (HIT) family protein
MDCVFCKIINHSLPAEILYETGRVIAILDINPIHHGHALVIPKTHCVDFLSIPETDLHEVLHASQLVARALVHCFGLEGFNIFSNNGRIAGQSVFHFHMHVTPRYPDDDIRFVLKLKSYPRGTMEDYARRIREFLPPSGTTKES